jgi:alcohol dehydrogenase
MSDEATAVLFEGPHRPFQVRRFPLPRLAAGEALVGVRLATICGSDLHTVDGRREVPCPTILGHEIVGTVAELGPGAPLTGQDGRPLEVGERVVWSLLVSCGSCFFCTHDLPQKCERLFKYGHECVTAEYALHGGLATHCHLRRGTKAFRVPDRLPDEVVAPAGCATATVVAALRHAGDVRGKVVLVHGAGMLGVTAAARARVLGAQSVIVCDPRRERLETARRFGATHIIRADDAVRDQIDALTAGRGTDVALEMSGAPSAVVAGIECVRVGGRVVWVGAVFPAEAAGFSAERVVRKHLSIQGVHNYLPDDLSAALAFLEEQHERFPFAELVTDTFPLEQVEAAFRRARESAAFRVAVAP